MLDIAIEDDRWQTAGLEALAERAATQTLGHQGLDADEAEISLLACDDDRIAVLNAEFRDKPTPTNVLSWPAQELAAVEAGGHPAQPEPDFMGELALGDIAISYDTCAREAQAAGKPMVDHVTHLIVHGVLHLLGYDHIRDADATVMEALEVEILGKMGINNPYME
ncbi:rRNA maturation RNase YbeY [Falsiruegeria mediterranea]|jgi:probable rRNA maturation factor|uniref:Endoribonuclease YbeY n=1 Tax=Falsiruegeria mediterranea M17 TaxID=1200281 RepID=A0A2R8C9Q2_9RHOB|nr:rRNA maturation RNase YbeY [Falsiruegeria mediterranea]SPJ29171.1 Endoribonuclease YbeY [Falsiruegeria mediterranea M17]